MRTTISDKRDEVKNLKTNLYKKEVEIIEAIYNLKAIMLKEENHEDDLISKKLKIKKQKEYENKFDELTKAKTLINERNRLKVNLYDERKNLLKYEKDYFLKEEERISKNKDIENRRNKILEKTCDFVKDHGMIKKGIEELEKLKKDKLNI
jgi:hypothetical protein